MDWVTSELHSVERWRTSHGVIADTRPAVDRNPAARGAAIATQTVTPICYSIHYATPGLRNCARAQYVSFDIWQGQQGFRLLPEHLDFPTAPLLHARAIINSTWSMTRSMARVHCPFANIRIICLISFFLWFFLRNEVRVKIGKNNRCAVFRMERKGANGFGYDTTDRSWYGWRSKYFSTACCRYHHR